MTRTITNIVLLSSIFLGTTSAQQPYSNRYHRLEETYRQILLNEMERDHTHIQDEIMKRRRARHEEEQFLRTADNFVHLWTEFAREYNAKGTFNVKHARDVSRAFHKLEKTEGWPREQSH